MKRVLRRTLHSRRLSFCLRLALGVTLVWASATKVFDAAPFADALSAYDLLPHSIVDAVAIVLPWLEMLTGLALIGGLLARSAGLVAAVLALAYVVATASAVARGLDISCGCFGDGGRALGWWDVLLRLAMVAAALHVVVAERTVGWPSTVLLAHRTLRRSR